MRREGLIFKTLVPETGLLHYPKYLSYTKTSASFLGLGAFYLFLPADKPTPVPNNLLLFENGLFHDPK
jgi:hypothetical protein